ncbi:Ger(x)C family spore germination protein [Paenibacillus sp. GYB004]|uniref:Ger(x)C family spore germination protein n=1 Tax=Paenibacillus sp. GYB004 TaxID=2994393 RepID=UPI002F963F20
MRIMRSGIVFALLAMLLGGCYDQTNLEDITLALTLGIDVNEDNELLIYTSSPVFSKEAKQKTEDYGVKATTIRQARGRLDSMVTAMTKSGKIQSILIGKQVLEQPGWFKLLDTLMRDAKMTVNSRIIAVDGSVADFMEFTPEDKPRLSQHIAKLIDTASRRNISFKTTVQEFHRQMFDKGMTPFVAELKKKRQLEITGAALLDERGKYATSLGLQETTLLQLLQNEKKADTSLTIPLPAASTDGQLLNNRASFYVKRAKTKIRPTFEKGKFVFQVKLSLDAAISENLNSDVQEEQIGPIIQAELDKEVTSLIRKLQKHRVDPVGFGMYARAYTYREWEKVKDRWAESFAEADIRLVTSVRVVGTGIMQ